MQALIICLLLGLPMIEYGILAPNFGATTLRSTVNMDMKFQRLLRFRKACNMLQSQYILAIRERDALPPRVTSGLTLAPNLTHDIRIMMVRSLGSNLSPCKITL